jgi:hypothetical protein
LIDTGATGGSYVDSNFAKQVCSDNGIDYIELPRPRPVRGYDGNKGKDITHAIFPKLNIQGHIDNVLLYVTQLHQPVILGKSWMAKHGVLLDMTTDSIHFKEGHCSHSNKPFRVEVVEVAAVRTKSSPNKVFRPQAIAKRTETSLAELDDVVRLTNQRKELPGPSQEVDTSDSESSTEFSSNSGSEGPPRKKKTRRGRKKTKKMADTGPELTIASVTSSINMIGAAPFAFLSKQKGA